MLPGTLLYVSLGHAGRAGLEAASGRTAQHRIARPVGHASRVGLAATVAVTLYVTRLARIEMSKEAGARPTGSSASKRPRVKADRHSHFRSQDLASRLASLATIKPHASTSACRSNDRASSPLPVLIASRRHLLARPRRRQAADRPNVVLIYADDIGYGDFGCYGATRVKTPHVDRLAAEGLRFTDAHSAAATCTPSRYAMLTGEYAWRKQGHRHPPRRGLAHHRPRRRPPSPDIFKQSGYATGVVGKWHLGLGSGEVDWNRDITPGPLEIGFDYSFLIPATGDRVPCVYVENHRVVGLDPADPIQVSYGKPIGNDPTGPREPRPAQDAPQPRPRPDHRQRHQPHRLHDRRQGRPLGRRRHGRRHHPEGRRSSSIRPREQTLLPLLLHPRHPRPPRAPPPLRRPDGNGPPRRRHRPVRLVRRRDPRTHFRNRASPTTRWSSSPATTARSSTTATRTRRSARLGDHQPAGPFRGGKYSLFEGGTRVPFIVRWPGHVKPGTSDALITQIDLLPSLAALLDQPLASDDAPDGQEPAARPARRIHQGRDHFVHHAGRLALREGTWKFIPPGKGARVLANTDIESGADDDGPALQPGRRPRRTPTTWPPPTPTA